MSSQDEMTDEVIFLKLDRTVVRQFKMLCAREGRQQKHMAGEALNWLFAKYGKARIADEGTGRAQPQVAKMTYYLADFALDVARADRREVHFEVNTRGDASEEQYAALLLARAASKKAREALTSAINTTSPMDIDEAIDSLTKKE